MCISEGAMSDKIKHIVLFIGLAALWEGVDPASPSTWWVQCGIGGGGGTPGGGK